MQTMKVKPWGSDQGDYVLINAEDFDAAVHVPYEPAAEVEAQPAARSTRRGKAQEQAAQ